MRAFVDLPDGIAVPIGSAGLLIGRHRGCDLQVADETASRRHALLRVAPEGVELIVLGRQPVAVDGRPCTGAEVIAPGARITFPGFEGTLRVELGEHAVAADYRLRRGRDRFPIRTSPFVIGGGADAHVIVAGWPAQALRFQIAQGQLYVEIDGGEPVAVRAGEEISYAGEAFTLEHADDGNSSTAPLADVQGRLAAAIEKVARESQRALGITLEPLPRGGRVTFRFPDGDRRVYLPGRRYQLISVLAETPGELVPDSELVARVWSDGDSLAGRQDVNVLLTRCRRDLLAAGVDPSSVLERAPGGGATRLL